MIYPRRDRRTRRYMADRVLHAETAYRLAKATLDTAIRDFESTGDAGDFIAIARRA